MAFSPQRYRFNRTDNNRIVDLGYTISTTDSITFIDFMQTFYPGFNLARLLLIVELQFSNTTPLTITRHIKYNKNGDLLINFRNAFTAEDDALLFIRRVKTESNEIHIYHDYCVIPISARNKGLVKTVFHESLQQYINMNARFIHVHAGLSSGGYVWAKYGFVAGNKAEVSQMLQKAETDLKKSEFRIVNQIYIGYYSKHPEGTSFPMHLWAALDYMKPVLSGSEWHGLIDLKNKEQFRIFSEYISK